MRTPGILSCLRSVALVSAMSLVGAAVAGAADDIPGFTPDPYPSASVMADPDTPVVVYTRKPVPGDAATAQAAGGNQAGRLLDKVRRVGRLRIIVGIDHPDPTPDAASSDVARHTGGLRAVQDAILRRVGLLGAGGAPTAAAASASVKRFIRVPGFAVAADAALVQRLLADPGVVSIEEDLPVPPSLSQSVPLIGGKALQDRGITGAGYTVAVLDSGTDTNNTSGAKPHPMLKGKVRLAACYSTNDPASRISSLCPNGEEEMIGPGSARNCPLTLRGCDHGTHVAGIAIGNMNSLKGVAPDARLVSIQVFSRVNNSSICGGTSTTPCIRAFNSDIAQALELVETSRSTYDIIAANLSLGGGLYGGACDNLTPVVTSAYNLVRAAGIATVTASGNSGGDGSVAFPACISTAIAVGATTKTGSEAVASFSNHSEQVRLLAPGASIKSAGANGKGETTTKILSGTSMAAPHVAGAFALLKQARPSATIEDILNALECTGKPVARAGVPKPRIDLVAARDFLVAGKPCSFDIVVADTGSEKDDIFVILVDGKEICRTPVGGRRECGIKGVGKGNHRLDVFIELAPDDLGTYTVTLGNGAKFSDGSTSKSGSPPEGTTVNYTIVIS